MIDCFSRHANSTQPRLRDLETNLPFTDTKRAPRTSLNEHIVVCGQCKELIQNISPVLKFGSCTTLGPRAEGTKELLQIRIMNGMSRLVESMFSRRLIPDE